MIQGEIAENQELEILSGRAGQIKVAGGEYVSTGFGSYKATLGPSKYGKLYNLKGLRIKEITGNLAEHPLKEINKEVRVAKMIDVDTPLPKYAGGGHMGIHVGLSDVSLHPILIGMLPSGLGVYQCPFVDV